MSRAYFPRGSAYNLYIIGIIIRIAYIILLWLWHAISRRTRIGNDKIIIYYNHRVGLSVEYNTRALSGTSRGKAPVDVTALWYYYYYDVVTGRTRYAPVWSSRDRNEHIHYNVIYLYMYVSKFYLRMMAYT